jgi:hypothetical protein
MRTLPVLLALLLASPVAAQAMAGPFAVPARAASFRSLQSAVDAIGGGSGTIVIAPGRYRQCAVQEAGWIAYVAQRPGSVVLEGTACEDKAALVLRGRAARVQGLVFSNLRVVDGNGAGIRLERGDLIVADSQFRDSESGILSGNDPSASLLVERSTFSGLGRCDRELDCAHSIYIGNYGRLTIRRSRFERGTGGHYVKSRSARAEIIDSSFDDTAGRGTNYMIDLPAGATGLIARNIFVQGRDKENYSAFIAVGAEERQHSSDGLAIAGNQAFLAPGMRRPAAFVADFSGDALRIEGNRLGPRIATFERR